MSSTLAPLVPLVPFAPRTEKQLLDALAEAVTAKTPLCIRGHGSKDGLGQWTGAAQQVLETTGLCGILQYEPSELVLRAGAGTPLSEIRDALADHNQVMAFEPLNLHSLLSGPSDSMNDSMGNSGTIGGMIAAGFAGSARIRHGSVRDHVLGFRAISGRGEAFKSGGNVMKNVTGFDLSKLMAGSMGTLAVMSEVTIKVLPAPEKTRTVLICGLSDSAAIEAMSCGVNSPHEITAAAHLPVVAALRSRVDPVARAGQAVTAIRVEGPAPSVESRCTSLCALLGQFGPVETLHSSRSAALWQEFNDLRLLTVDTPDHHIWRVSVPPREGARVAGAVLGEYAPPATATALYDWGGGLVWLALPPGDDQQDTTVRRHLQGTGGHATLVRASADARQRMRVFQPPSAGVDALSRRIKGVFDPQTILNPGRLYPGM